MNWVSRQEALRVLEEVRVRKVCQYHGMPGGICDCKFGGPIPNTEQTGCPELRLVLNILSVIGDPIWDSVKTILECSSRTPIDMERLNQGAEALNDLARKLVQGRDDLEKIASALVIERDEALDKLFTTRRELADLLQQRQTHEAACETLVRENRALRTALIMMAEAKPLSGVL